MAASALGLCPSTSELARGPRPPAWPSSVLVRRRVSSFAKLLGAGGRCAGLPVLILQGRRDKGPQTGGPTATPTFSPSGGWRSSSRRWRLSFSQASLLGSLMAAPSRRVLLCLPPVPVLLTSSYRAHACDSV